ncbi:MAG: 16S rRNA (cytidine(1402)-2'-O)-methyltransferase [Cyclobacteriaceae bacterium]
MREPAALYPVPTPIGNLEDITLRAIRVLSEVDLILAEDTRTSGHLLKHLEIKKPLKSYHIHNEHKALSAIIAQLQGGTTMALISDAGTPAISDPGFLLVRECLKNDISIESLPGATAFVPALVKSGFSTDRFVFEGFLPHKKGRQTRLQIIAEEPRTIVLYESPHRLLKALDQLEEYIGESRKVSVSRELTKMYEETVTGTIKEVKAHFDNGNVKGEIVIVIDGKT